MKRKTQILRVIAVFLLLNFVTQIVLPTAVWALTAGPTAPEFSSFEPVDTTDMVNLATGDLTYNIPLLEVPGPEGGYPLSLSYHAGIQPDEEASWVGLGWTLNPGAINRTVSGHPDDVIQNETNFEYWRGGEKDDLGIGVSFKVAGAVGANFGLSFSNDTYRGFGVGADVSFGVGLNGNASVGLGVSTDPYGGNPSLNAGINVGTSTQNSKSLSGGIGVSTNFENVSVGLSGGISAHGYVGGSLQRQSASLLGASISSSSLKPSTTFAAASIQSINNKSDNISTSISGFSVSIPVWYSVWANIGYNYTRYWSAETSNSTLYGSLYYPLNPNAFSSSFDSYVINNAANPALETDKSIGGCLPAYDLYNVTGQGIGGTIQPYIFENLELYRKNRRLNVTTPDLTYILPSTQSVPRSVNFRFRNDFSNSLKKDNTLHSVSTNLNDDQVLDLMKNTDPNPYNPAFIESKNHLAGSRHIEWFTNKEIINRNSDLIYDKKSKVQQLVVPANYTHKLNFDAQGNNLNIEDQIGGFMITNESGVTYHYSLPVYAFDEFTMASQIDDPGTFNSTYKARPYAYTWLLVAITGPDYVDRGNLGKLDDDDYGYWINFDYGLWLKDYKWRNPAQGFHKDIDSKSLIYSYGKKEIYYLDAISTRSHIALFEKTLRDDGKEVANNAEGNIVGKRRLATDEYLHFQSTDEFEFLHPRSLLKLNNIYLYKKDVFDKLIKQNNLNQLSNLKSKDPQKYNFTFTYSGNFVHRTNLTLYSNYKVENVEHNSHNVLDDDDISTITDFKNKALRVVNFESNNSMLCGKTPNSFKASDVYVKGINLDPNLLQSKLTLTKINFLGKGGSSSLPGLKFNYPSTISGLNPDYNKNKKDIWGNYCATYNGAIEDFNQNIARQPQIGSNPESWSMSAVETPTGAKISIQYEADDYTYEGIKLNNYLTIDQVELMEQNKFRIRFKENVNLSEYVAYDSELRFNFLNVEWSIAQYFNQGEFLVHNITNNYIDVEFPSSNQFISRVRSEELVILGHMYFNSNKKLGGGLRVKHIAIEANGTVSRTNYAYIDENGKSSGQTSYTPLHVPTAVLTKSQESTMSASALFDFNLNRLKNFTTALVYAREIPSPGVLYKKVTVAESFIQNGVVTNSPSKKVYEFAVYDQGLNNIMEQSANTLAQTSNFIASKLTIKDFASRVGNLLRVTTYGADNLPLNEIKNVYLHQLTATNGEFIAKLSQDFNDQGRVDQLFYEYRTIGENLGKQLVVTRKEEYPNILVRQEVTNLKNTKVSNITENLAFDYYSGLPVKVKSTDVYGNVFIAVTEPAYQHYPSMGLKINNFSNKNMLIQESTKYTYQAVSSADYSSVGLVAANIQTWSNNINVLENDAKITQPNIWRKQAAYIWTNEDVNTPLSSNGLLDYNAFTSGLNGFNWSNNTSNNPNWRREEQITLYDVYSHGLEAVDFNGKYAANQYNYNNQLVMASALNVKANLYAYAGAEVFADNATKERNVLFQNGEVSNDFAHTGSNSLKVSAGAKGYKFMLNANQYEINKRYIARVWVRPIDDSQTNLNDLKIIAKKGDGTVLASSSVLPKNKSKDWYLIELIFTTPNNLLSDIHIECTNQNNDNRPVYFDDFKVHPIDATVTAYIYNNVTGELNYILGNNNLYAKFEYDAAGRLIKQSVELFYYADKIVETRKYNYKK